MERSTADKQFDDGLVAGRKARLAGQPNETNPAWAISFAEGFEDGWDDADWDIRRGRLDPLLDDESSEYGRPETGSWPSG